MFPYKIQLEHGLQPADPEQRIVFRNWLMAVIDGDRLLLDNLYMTEAPHFWLNDKSTIKTIDIGWQKIHMSLFKRHFIHTNYCLVHDFSPNDHRAVLFNVLTLLATFINQLFRATSCRHWKLLSSIDRLHGFNRTVRHVTRRTQRWLFFSDANTDRFACWRTNNARLNLADVNQPNCHAGLSLLDSRPSPPNGSNLMTISVSR
jgi:hypothetical protein